MLLLLLSAVASGNVCENRDGDCPSCPFLEINPVAETHLSGEPELVQSANEADDVIRNLSAAGGKDILRFDEPATKLHTSLFYFCCHTLFDIGPMTTALQQMDWSSFEIDYDSFSCNNDHDNATVYLHALPSNQTALFAWARLVETTLAAAGIPIHHPRTSLFHMTLARVTPSYPVDRAVQALASKTFGTHRLCSFDFAGTTITARDCRQPHEPHDEPPLALAAGRLGLIARVLAGQGVSEIDRGGLAS